MEWGKPHSAEDGDWKIYRNEKKTFMFTLYITKNSFHKVGQTTIWMSEWD